MNSLEILENNTTDGKLYHVAQLSNGLRVLLVTRDPKGNLPSSELSAVALSVAVGSANDPPEFLGISHLVEHVMFMGTKEYPGENEWENFLSLHGGYSNACNQDLSTTFHYEVQNSALEESLDRFASFFKGPLFRQDSIDREVLAVDSEFQIGKQSDALRMLEIWRHTSAKGSFFSKFTWGNAESLRNVKSSDLMEYFDLNYCPSKMNLVIHCMSSSPSDILQLVCRQFDPIPCRKSPAIPPQPEPLFDSQFNVFHIESITETSLLSFAWQLPSFNADQSRSCDVVCEVIGFEGKGSLLAELKSNGYASSLSASVDQVDFQRNSHFWLLSVELEVTKKGIECMDKVIRLVTQYSEFLSRVTEEQFFIFWQELSSFSKYARKFYEASDPCDFVETLALRMTNRDIPLKGLIESCDIHKFFDFSSISTVVSHLSFENCRIDIQCPSAFIASCPLPFSESPRALEDIFQIPFKGITVSRSYLHEGLTEFKYDFHLPRPNRFIPTSIELTEPSVPLYPKALLTCHENVKVFHCTDNRFNSPRGSLAIAFANPQMLQSQSNGHVQAKEMLLLSLWIVLVEEYINDFTYECSMAGIDVSINTMEYQFGVELKVSGFTDRMFDVTRLVLSLWEDFGNLKDWDRFGIVKEFTTDQLKSQNLKSSKYCKHLRLSLLHPMQFPLELLLQELEPLSLAQVIDFHNQFVSSVSTTVFAYGNFTETSVTQFVDSVISKSVLKPGSFMANARPLFLRDGVECSVQATCLYENDPNSAICNFYQSKDSGEIARARVKLLERILYEPLFDELRTVQQLGYEVSCSRSYTLGVLGMRVEIVSSSALPLALDLEIENFLTEFLDELNDLSDEDFESHLSGLLDELKSADNNLREIADRCWDEIVQENYMFDRVERTMKILEETTQDDIIELYNSIFCDSSRRKLSVQVSAVENADHIEGHISPTDILNFRMNRPSPVLDYLCL